MVSQGVEGDMAAGAAGVGAAGEATQGGGGTPPRACGGQDRVTTLARRLGLHCNRSCGRGALQHDGALAPGEEKVLKPYALDWK